MPSAPLLTIYKGLSTQLGKSSSNASKLTHDGRLYLTTDDGYLYYDIPDDDNLYGATPTTATRKAINAKKALSAGQVENAIQFFVDGTAQSAASATYNGGAPTSVYIGTNLAIGPNDTVIAHTAVSEAANAVVYINLLTRNGTSAAYAKKASFTLTGLGDIKVYADSQGNITIKDVHYSASGGLTLGQDGQFSHSNTAITPGTIGDAQSGGTDRTLQYGGKFEVPKITYDSYGHITGTTKTELTLPALVGVFTKATSNQAGTAGLVPAPAAGTSTLAYLNSQGTWSNPDTHYVTHLFVNGAAASDTHIASDVANGNVHIRLYDFIDTTHQVREAIKIKGTGSVEVKIVGTDTSGSTGTITIHGVNTTYTATAGIQITGANNAIGHINALTAAGSRTATANNTAIAATGVTLAPAEYFEIPIIYYDIHGHITGAVNETKKIVLPGIYTGCTTNAAGTAGFVKAPPIRTSDGAKHKFLCDDGDWEIPEYTTDTHYTTKLFVNGTTAAQAHANVVGNGDLYLRLYDDSVKESDVKIIGADGTTVTSSTAGVITIASEKLAFTAGAGISITPTTSGNNTTYTIGHSNVSVTANSQNNTTTSITAETIAIPVLTYDTEGHLKTYNTNSLSLSAFSGASAGGNGAKGLVPAPTQQQFQDGCFLSASGAWVRPSYTTDTHYDTFCFINSDLQPVATANSLTNGNVYLRIGDKKGDTYVTNSTVKLVGRVGIGSAQAVCSGATGLTVTSDNTTIYIDAHVFTAYNATTSTAGVHGLVPAPGSSAINGNFFLKWDGSWDSPQDTTYTFTGSSSGTSLASYTDGGYDAGVNPGATAAFACKTATARYNQIRLELEREDVDENSNAQVGYQMSASEVNGIFNEVFETSYSYIVGETGTTSE